MMPLRALLSVTYPDGTKAFFNERHLAAAFLEARRPQASLPIRANPGGRSDDGEASALDDEVGARLAIKVPVAEALPSTPRQAQRGDGQTSGGDAAGGAESYGGTQADAGSQTEHPPPSPPRAVASRAPPSPRESMIQAARLAMEAAESAKEEDAQSVQDIRAEHALAYQPAVAQPSPRRMNLDRARRDVGPARGAAKRDVGKGAPEVRAPKNSTKPYVVCPACRWWDYSVDVEGGKCKKCGHSFPPGAGAKATMATLSPTQPSASEFPPVPSFPFLPAISGKTAHKGRWRTQSSEDGDPHGESTPSPTQPSEREFTPSVLRWASPAKPSEGTSLAPSELAAALQPCGFTVLPPQLIEARERLRLAVLNESRVKARIKEKRGL